MESMPNFRLKELRKARGITQLKLAMDLNMSQNTISRYENGQREAGYAELMLFADYFNVFIIFYLIHKFLITDWFSLTRINITSTNDITFHFYSPQAYL